MLQRIALAAALTAALAGCASPGANVALEPHLAWPVADDAGWATAPSLGVARFADERPEELRRGYRPPLRLFALGVAREGVWRSGDADFDRPISDGVRADVVATLRRAGTFAAVREVDFDPRDPGAWPLSGAPALVLVAAVESFEGHQWRSFAATPFQLGLVRERWGPAQGRVSLRVEVWSKAERVWDARVSVRRETATGGAARAALQALGLASEKLALRLDARLRAPRAQPPRRLEVRVLDGCDLGEARVRRLVAETSAIYEREAGVVLVGEREPWLKPPRGASLDALLERAQDLAPSAGGVVLALAPEEQVRESGLGSVRTGLSVPLGDHALALCGADDEVSVLTAAHELAHLFGAVHVRDAASIMHAMADFDARFFDPLNRAILRSMRARDFGTPLPPAESARLAALYRGAEASGEVDARDLDSALRALDAAGP